MIQNKHIIYAGLVLIAMGLVTDGWLFFYSKNEISMKKLAISKLVLVEPKEKSPLRKNKKSQEILFEDLQNLAAIQANSGELCGKLLALPTPIIFAPKGAEVRQRYVLTGIWFDGKRPSAIIDGEIFEAGQLLADKRGKVVQILKDTVIVDREGEKIVLKLEE